MKLGHAKDVPEFPNVSWFSTMFGIGLLTCATAEPMYHWALNPDTIRVTTSFEWAGPWRAALFLWLGARRHAVDQDI